MSLCPLDRSGSNTTYHAREEHRNRAGDEAEEMHSSIEVAGLRKSEEAVQRERPRDAEKRR